ncbi:unnamed protein product [Calypogeia fissa]
METAASQRPSLLQTVGQQQQLINVKAEPATEVSREVGSPAPILAVSNPASATVSNDVKPSPLSGTIQTSGAYCCREEILKKEMESSMRKVVLSADWDKVEEDFPESIASSAVILNTASVPAGKKAAPTRKRGRPSVVARPPPVNSYDGACFGVKWWRGAVYGRSDIQQYSG